MDKPSGASKPWFPVTVSYVSIQGGDDQNLELDAIGPDFSAMNKKTFLRSPTFMDNSNPGSTLRVERSKTSLMPPGRHAKEVRSPHPFNSIGHDQHKGKLGKPEITVGRPQARDITPSSWSTTPTAVPPPSQNSTPDFKSTPLLGTAHNFSNGKSQSQWLPKPTVPSSDYLDGNRGLSTNFDPSSMLRSLNSPRASFDQGGDGVGDMESFEAHLLSRFKR